MVRAFAHGAMGRRIDPSLWKQLNYVDQPAGFPAECFKVPRLSVNLKKRDVAPW